MGNITSVEGALGHLGVNPVVTDNPDTVRNADVLLLPGVGSFYKAMSKLNESGLTDAIKEAVIQRERKILGICLGMQLMAEFGSEDGGHTGLGFLSGKVERFQRNEHNKLKIPHVGFNAVMFNDDSKLFARLGNQADFYFVHSYRLMPERRPGISSLCLYGGEFLAAYEHKNVYCTQFHPEKSQTNGLKLLSNFLSV